MDIHPPHAIHSWKDFGIQLITITAGILIALSLEGMRESIRDRALVREARETIAREIADNKKSLDGEIGGMAEQTKNCAAAISFADEILKTGKTTVHTLNLEIHFADLSAAGWQTAERTGALGHMDYAEVQRLARVYALQDLYVQQQRRTFEHLSAANAILALGSDPTMAPKQDIERFRQQMLTIASDLLADGPLAGGLSKRYAEALK